MRVPRDAVRGAALGRSAAHEPDEAVSLRVANGTAS
jgi:hypothetical protein